MQSYIHARPAPSDSCFEAPNINTYLLISINQSMEFVKRLLQSWTVALDTSKLQ